MDGRAKGTADHYWPWAVFFKILKFRQGSGPEGDDVLYNTGGNFRPSVGGRGSLRGDGAWPEGRGWLEAWNKGAEA